MDSSFLASLRQSLPDYLVSGLTLAGVTSLDVFLALSDGPSASPDVLPVAEVVSYLREQVPLFTSDREIRAYLPSGLSAAARDLESARRHAERWSIPPGAKFRLFRVQSELKAQVEALQLSAAEARRLVNLPFSVTPRPHPTLSHQTCPPAVQQCSSRREEPPDAAFPMQPTPAKLPRLDAPAASEAGGDFAMGSEERSEEGGRRRRTRKRARRSKNPPPAPVPVSSPAPAPVPVSSRAPAPIPVSSRAPAPIPVSSRAPAPVPVSSRAPAPVPVSRQAPRPSPVPPATPPAGAARLGHVIFDSDGEVAEERQLCVHPRALEVAQNRRQCKSKPSFEFPEMSKKAQLNSRQTNRSFLLKNDGSTPEIPAHALRKQLAPVAKIQDISSSSLEVISAIPPKKAPLLRRCGPKVVNVDLDKDSSSSSSSESESESEAESEASLRRSAAEDPQRPKDSAPLPEDSRDTTHPHSDGILSGKNPEDAPCSQQDPKAVACVLADPLKDTSHKDLSDSARSCGAPEEIPPGPGKSPSPPHPKDTDPLAALNGPHVESTPSVGPVCPERRSPRDYSLLGAIEQPPADGSLIAFKVLELDPNSFTPEVSDFKEGRFLSFDRAKRRCRIEVLTNKRTSVGEGKFDVWMESSDGQILTNFEEEEETLVTSWDALQEVKLISGPSS